MDDESNITHGGISIGEGGQVTLGQGNIAGRDINIYNYPAAPKPGSAPPLPSLIVGREEALRDLKSRLGVTSGTLQLFTAIRGWPGVGKTAVAAMLAHDPDVVAAFPDGVLWVSLGPNPNLLS